MTSTLDIARSYRDGGLSVVPIRCDGTKAAFTKWEPYQERLATDPELQAWFGNGTPRGVAIVYGRISGNAECIDFDEATLYEPFAAEVNKLAPGLIDRLTRVETPRPGCHLIYRCEAVEGNQKLAFAMVDGKPKVTIETRGTGGYALAPGCPGSCHPSGGTYDHLAGPALEQLTTITAAERAILFRVARSFNEVVDEEPQQQAASNGKAGLSPGDEYNQRTTWTEILEPLGWIVTHSRGNITYWRRPGKDVGWSATSGSVSKAGNELFCCFSDNAHPFQGANGCKPCSTYTKFAAYALLNHNGDYGDAARELGRNGFGEQRERRNKPNVRPGEYRESTTPPRTIERQAIAEVIAQNPALNPYVVNKLFREGETVNIISVSKIGKSWFAYLLALCIIAGRDFLGQFITAPGKVLLIDNELHPSVLAHRIPAVADALGIDREQYDLDLEVVSLRGNLCGLSELGELIDRIQRGEFKLIIMDAWYRFVLGGVSENDNAAMAAAYNLIDQFGTHTKAAIALIHHSSKGSQSDKRVTDVGAGAGAQSRAADCHLILREHEEEGVVVLEAAVRSFAPVEPLALRWNFPLWVPASGVDPGKLKGRQTRREEEQSEKDREGVNQIIKALADGPATARSLREKTGISRERQQRLLDWLMSEGQISAQTITIKGKECREYFIKETAEK